MCGICGAVWTDPRAALDGEHLEAVLDRIVHRGPDDAGQYRDNHAALGFRRLSIVVSCSSSSRALIAAFPLGPDAGLALERGDPAAQVVEPRREVRAGAHVGDFRLDEGQPRVLLLLARSQIDGSVVNRTHASLLLAVAEQTDRRCYAMDIDPRYVAVAIARWEQFTGRKAERANG